MRIFWTCWLFIISYEALCKRMKLNGPEWKWSLVQMFLCRFEILWSEELNTKDYARPFDSVCLEGIILLDNWSVRYFEFCPRDGATIIGYSLWIQWRVIYQTAVSSKKWFPHVFWPFSVLCHLKFTYPQLALASTHSPFALLLSALPREFHNRASCP